MTGVGVDSHMFVISTTLNDLVKEYDSGILKHLTSSEYQPLAFHSCWIEIIDVDQNGTRTKKHHCYSNYGC